MIDTQKACLEMTPKKTIQLKYFVMIINLLCRYEKADRKRILSVCPENKLIQKIYKQLLGVRSYKGCYEKPEVIKAGWYQHCGVSFCDRNSFSWTSANKVAPCYPSRNS